MSEYAVCGHVQEASALERELRAQMKNIGRIIEKARSSEMEKRALGIQEIIDGTRRVF